MCGITGIAHKSPVDQGRLKAMTDALAHRGPDGEGFWMSDNGSVGLGNRRLAVIDRGLEGTQPMTYAGGRYTLTYNGEIYNYIELREALRKEGYTFKTDTDTEVILALYDKKKASCLEDLDGMFAFALYDALEERLFFARDRFGEKPLYFAHEPGKYFAFASEMKALWAGGFDRKVNEEMLYSYLRFGLLQNIQDRSETFYDGIRRLENGHYLTLDTRNLTFQKTPYWNLEYQPDRGTFDEPSATEAFRELMQRSVSRRLRSDVRVGGSLSGGLDSTLILHLASAGRGSFDAFSARFPGFSLDEGPYIIAAAGKERAVLHECFPRGKECWEAFQKVCFHQEEPFGSAGIYAQYKVMESAKEAGVTVLLDGQGADEILGGYPHYRQEGWKAGLRKRWPGLARRLHSRITEVPVLSQEFNAAYGTRNHLPGPAFDYRFQSINGALHFDLVYGGLQDLLRYSDRNAMAMGREVRLPFLDHELVRFMLSLPSTAKIEGGIDKRLLRLAFARMLPEIIITRRDKIGFEPPQRAWMTEVGCEDLVRQARMILVQKGILPKSVLKRPLEPTDAYEKGDGGWRVLMGAAVFM